MQEDVWKAPDAAESGVTPALARGPGDLSDPMAVPNLVMADVKAHLGPYVLAGLGYLVATFGFIGVVLAVLFGSMAPGILAEDETLAMVGMGIGFTAYVVGILGFGFVVAPLMNASLLRALDEQRRGGAPIGFTSAFSTMRQGAGRVIGFYLLGQLAVLVGMLFLYIPGIVAAVVTTFALPIVVFEDVAPVTALQLGWKHLKAHPMWHVPLWLLMFIGIVLLEFSIVGLVLIYPVMVAFQLFAYRVAYGDPGALESHLS